MHYKNIVTTTVNICAHLNESSEEEHRVIHSSVKAMKEFSEDVRIPKGFRMTNAMTNC